MNESERTWEEVAVTYFKTLPQHIPGGTEEKQSLLE